MGRATLSNGRCNSDVSVATACVERMDSYLLSSGALESVEERLNATQQFIGNLVDVLLDVGALSEDAVRVLLKGGRYEVVNVRKGG